MWVAEAEVVRDGVADVDGDGGGAVPVEHRPQHTLDLGVGVVPRDRDVAPVRVRTIGTRSRSGSVCSWGSEVPFGQRCPCDHTSSRLPRISVTRSPSTRS